MHNNGTKRRAVLSDKLTINAIKQELFKSRQQHNSPTLLCVSGRISPSGLVPLLHSVLFHVPVHSTMWPFPCCRMATPGSTELPPRVCEDHLETCLSNSVTMSCYMELTHGCTPTDPSASQTSPGSVITVMHITSALIHSSTALHLFCSLCKNKAVVFLYVRNWINQTRSILQALFKPSSRCL